MKRAQKEQKNVKWQFRKCPSLQEEAAEPRVMHDSGFSLADTELFDAGLDEDDEEEESLDAIRAAAKSKFKTHKVSSGSAKHTEPSIYSAFIYI